MENEKKELMSAYELQERTIHGYIQLKNEVRVHKDSILNKVDTIIPLNEHCMSADVKEKANKDVIDSLKLQLKEYTSC